MSTTHIQLSKLAISPENARKTFTKTGIDEMQASILAHGLMQNLVVTEGDKGKYYVVAGGRRLTAMQGLQKEGKTHRRRRHSGTGRQPRIEWYERHSFAPRIYFRIAGILTILFSVSLPAVAAIPSAKFDYKDIVLSVMSVAIAALTGLSSFFRWDNMWRRNKTAQMDLQRYVAKWELEITNARLLLPDDQKANHIYKATDDLLVNAATVISSESEGFFSGLQFPQQNTTTKAPGPAA
jgi:hypothetical protein